MAVKAIPVLVQEQSHFCQVHKYLRSDRVEVVRVLIQFALKEHVAPLGPLALRFHLKVLFIDPLDQVVVRGRQHIFLLHRGEVLQPILGMIRPNLDLQGRARALLLGRRVN